MIYGKWYFFLWWRRGSFRNISGDRYIISRIHRMNELHKHFTIQVMNELHKHFTIQMMNELHKHFAIQVMNKLHKQF
jgi:hypothetical protein